MSGVDLLGALGSAVDAARDDRRTAAALVVQEICPACCGNGEIFVERLFGRSAPEPYLTRTCTSCGGTGMVPAEAVAFCGGCKEPFWVDEVCTHQGEPLCVDCKPAPVCRDCVTERAER